MSILFVGSNPGVLFYDERDQPIIFASLWIAEWTPFGSGSAVIIVDAKGWRGYGSDAKLASRFANDFMRYFPEVVAFPWTGGILHSDETLVIDLNPAIHVHAVSNSVQLKIWDVLDFRTTTVEAFPLGEQSPRLKNVYIPCGSAILTERGHPVVGKPVVASTGGKTSSTAYLAIAEVWETT